MGPSLQIGNLRIDAQQIFGLTIYSMWHRAQYAEFEGSLRVRSEVSTVLTGIDCDLVAASSHSETMAGQLADSMLLYLTL